MEVCFFCLPAIAPLTFVVVLCRKDLRHDAFLRNQGPRLGLYLGCVLLTTVIAFAWAPRRADWIGYTAGLLMIALYSGGPIWACYFWIVAGGFGFRRWEAGHAHCLHCGYDLTGNVSGVCPECGELI